MSIDFHNTSIPQYIGIPTHIFIQVNECNKK